MAIRLAVDAMGGDNAPRIVIEGLNLALPHLGSDVSFLLFGDEKQLKPLLAEFPKVQKLSAITHTEDYIPGDMKPSAALRQGKDSSMRLAIDSVKEGQADAVVSAGNTGAYMALSKIVLRMIPGITRPAIGGVMPTRKNGSVMLDLGANAECSAEVLVQFALMGRLYAQSVLKVKEPSIRLLNIGSEDSKGRSEIQEAHNLLKNDLQLPGYEGFIEGNHLMDGDVDVIVCDGFSGNVALKSIEGAVATIKALLKISMKSSWLAKLGYLFVRPAFEAFRKSYDPRRFNGAPFLGLSGIAVKSHGGADAYSFSCAVRTSIDLVKNQVTKQLQSDLEKWTHPTESQPEE